MPVDKCSTLSVTFLLHFSSVWNTFTIVQHSFTGAIDLELTSWFAIHPLSCINLLQAVFLFTYSEVTSIFWNRLMAVCFGSWLQSNWWIKLLNTHDQNDSQKWGEIPSLRDVTRKRGPFGIFPLYFCSNDKCNLDYHVSMTVVPSTKLGGRSFPNRNIDRNKTSQRFYPYPRLSKTREKKSLGCIVFKLLLGGLDKSWFEPMV